MGLTAFAGQTVADSGGNGRGNGRGNGNGNGEGNGNGNGAENRPVDPVVICHVPPGNPDNEHTIEVGSPAVDAHVENHGDATGPCGDTTSTTTSTSSPTTTAPASTSTTTTSTTTSSSSTTTTSSSSTSPAVAPNAVSDIGVGSVGQSVSVSVLANDLVGSPTATIVQTDFAAVGACSGLSFDQTTGLLSGAPTVAGACLFTYVIENSAGFDAAAVLVPVS